jgi:glycosyltransferase involved in cell wall biosynthesis
MSSIAKKKVFCPIPLPPPFYGSNIVNQNIISSRIINENFEFDVLSISYNKKTENVGRLTILKVFLILKNFFLICKKASVKYDLVYYVPAVTGLEFIRDFFLLLPLKMARQNILIHLHGKGIKINTDRSRLYKGLYRLFFKNTSIICLSEKLTYDVEDVHKGSVYVVNNGIEAEIHEYEKELNEPPVILYLSNLMETKGVLTLLEAANVLKERQIDFRLNLVGAPMNDIMKKINSLISKYKLGNNLISIGPKYKDEKKEAFQRADVFVLPTYYDKECFPLVLLEAMSFNLPVISTDEGAITDIIDDGETGFIVNKKDSVGLAEKLVLLLKDEELRIKMGRNGFRKFKNKYTDQITEKKILEVFNDVINKKSLL